MAPGQVFRSSESPVDSLSKRLSTSAVLKELSTPEGAGRGATHEIQRKSIAKRRLSGWSKLRSLHARAFTVKAWLGLEETHATILKFLVEQRVTHALLGGAEAASGHGKYVQKLRTGTKAGMNLIHSDVAVKVKTAAEQRRAAADIAAGIVTTEVTDSSALDQLELWQQGDESLYTDAKLEKRLKLRRDRRVAHSLQLFWEAAQRGDYDEAARADAGAAPGPAVGKGGDDGGNGGDAGDAGTISFAGYSNMYRRLYRVILKRYDAADAAKSIAADWRNDAKGGSKLPRRAFCDSLFELADMWTAGICPYEYAVFLTSLFDKIATVAHSKDQFGYKVTHHVWKEEGHCVYDAVTFGGGDEAEEEVEAEEEGDDEEEDAKNKVVGRGGEGMEERGGGRKKGWVIAGAGLGEVEEEAAAAADATAAAELEVKEAETAAHATAAAAAAAKAAARAAAAAAAAAEAEAAAAAEAAKGVPGTAWIESTAPRPSDGTVLTNAALESALGSGKKSFTIAELETFGLPPGKVGWAVYVKVRGKWYRPMAKNEGGRGGKKGRGGIVGLHQQKINSRYRSKVSTRTIASSFFPST